MHLQIDTKIFLKKNGHQNKKHGRNNWVENKTWILPYHNIPKQLLSDNKH